MSTSAVFAALDTFPAIQDHRAFVRLRGALASPDYCAPFTYPNPSQVQNRPAVVLAARLPSCRLRSARPPRSRP